MWKFLKYCLTIFVLILIPTYWYYYGLQNFLWLSDVGLFLTLLALWMQSRLLMSMAAVGVLFVELAWNVDFFSHIVFNKNLINLADYMFNATYPLGLRALSLFHVFMPIIWIFYLIQFGYDRRALYYIIPLYWIILLCTYFFTNPHDNINWAFLPHLYNIQAISPHAWISMLAIGFPLLIFVPTHFLYKKICRVKRDYYFR